MIRATRFNARGEDEDLDLESDAELKISDNQLLWIDLDGRDADDLAAAAKAIGLDADGLGRLSTKDRRPRMLRLEDRILLTLGAVDADDPEAQRRELDIVIGRNHVITVHEGPLQAIDDFRAEVDNEPHLGKLDAASFTAGLIDVIFTAFFRQIESLERDIDALDELAIRARASGRFLADVVSIRRRVSRLRRALAPNREALLPLERPDFELRADLGPVWPGIVQRLERAIDGLENVRELLVGSFDLYLGRASQRTNDVMKVLTLVSAIALPGIVLAGVMGMNFKLAFFDQANNFFVVVAAMVIFGVVITVIARWRHWI